MSSAGDIEPLPTNLSKRNVRFVAIFGVLIGCYFATVELAPYNWDPVSVVSVGEEDPVRRGYAERVFDREIPLLPELGHDGRFFIIQAMDPLFLNPETHARYLDRPTYRAQRMLFPSLAGLARPFAGAQGIAWAMVGLNVILFGAGTAGTAALARQFGLSAWWGLAFALNPGVRFELGIDGGGVLAFAAVMVAVAFSSRRDTWPVVISLCAAVLAREVMLLCAFGLAVAKGIGSVRRRALIAGIPALAGGAWWVYVQLRLGDLSGGKGIQELGLPFRGFLDAWDFWLTGGGLSLLIGPFYVFLALVMLPRALRRWSVLEMPAAGFAVLGLLLTRPVWLQHYDITRALIALPTFFALSLAASLFGQPGSADSPSLGTHIVSDGEERSS